MKNSDDKPQYKTYDFNTDPQGSKQRRRRTTNYLHGWWIGILIIAIALGIVYGINLWQNHSQPARNTAIVSQKSKKQIDKITAASKKRSAQKDANTRVTDFRQQLKQQDQDGVTAKQRASLQKQIDTEANKNARSQEQTLLDNTSDRKPPKAKQNTENADPFSQTHTFSSVADAKSWANTTKNQWLKMGYSNYTITANGQGYFVLRFLK